LGVQDDAVKRFVQDQRLIKSATSWIFGKSESAGGVSLGIAVDDQSTLFRSGERGAEVDRGGGFSNSTLLICDCDNASHETPECESNLYLFFQRYKMFHVKRRDFCFTWNVFPRFTWNTAIYGPAIDYRVPMRSDLLSEPGILASARQFQESSFAIFAPSSSPIQ
jgi:hypothetical protein